MFYSKEETKMSYYIRGEYSADVERMLYRIVHKKTNTTISVSDNASSLKPKLEELNQVKIPEGKRTVKL